MIFKKEFHDVIYIVEGHCKNGKWITEILQIINKKRQLQRAL